MSKNNQVVSPQVSILIPVFNQLHLTRKCLLTIKDNTPHDMIEVIIIDNASTDGTPEFLKDWTGPFSLKVIRNDENMGYAKANNQGARMACGKYLVLLNNDTKPKPDWLPPLIDVFAQHERVGAVGAKLLYPDGTIQHAGVITVKDDAHDQPLVPVHFGHHQRDAPGFNKLAQFPAVTGACMVVLKSTYQKFGGLDEAFWNGYEDVDFCFKLLDAGFDVYYQPKSVVVHYESKSGDQRFVRTKDNIRELNRRWRDKITCQFIWTDSKRLIPNDGVTVVMVTYNSSGAIIPCLEQLNGTLRENDDVVIVDNASRDQTKEVVRKYIAGREKYRFIVNEKNLGYAHAANMGADTSHNPHIIFLKPGTIVTPQWIERLLKHLKPHKVAAVGPVSDDLGGNQKVEFGLSPKRLNSHKQGPLHEQIRKKNEAQSTSTKLLMGFCLMVKRNIFNRVGRMDNNLLFGNEDLDLSWRLRDAGYRLVIAKDTLVYHQEPRCNESESKALADQLVQESSDYLHYKLLRHFGLENLPSASDLWGIDWFHPTSVFNENQPLTSMIMLTYNQLKYTRLCIESVFKHTRVPFELIVVDNGSVDGTLDYISSLKRSRTACVRIKIIANQANMGFAKGCNQGLVEARGQYLLLLNNDIVVTAGWLSKLLQVLSSPQVGICGPMSNYVSGQQLVKEVGYNVNDLSDLDKFANDYAKQHVGQIIQNWRLVGFCLLVKRELIEKIGGLDEGFKVGNFEDDDFCLRACLAGYKGAIAKDCFIHHYGSQSFVGNQIDFSDRLQKNWILFKHKWCIPPETPYAAQYRVLTPTGGFDKVKHYIPIAMKPPPHDTTQGNHHKSAIYAFSDNNQGSMAKPKMPKHPKGEPPGGISMQIFDQTLEAVKQYLSSPQRGVAIWILERIIEKSPQHGHAHHELGMLYYEQEELSKAQSHLHKAVRYTPENKTFYKDLGDFYHVVHKDNAKALQMYEKAIEMDPHSVDLLLTVAHLCTAGKFFEKAKSYYQRVLNLQPDNQDAQLCYGKIIDCFESNSVAESMETIYMRAQSQILSGDRQSAVESLKIILEKNPEHALAHNDYAVLAYEMGDKDIALHHYEKAVAINPENLLFLKNLADFYWCEQGNGRAAMQLNVQVLSTDPADMETILSCAQICMALGKNDDARDFVNRAKEIDLFNETASLLADQLDGGQATDHLQTDRNMLYQQAKSRAGNGDLEGAVEVLTRLVREYRQDAEAFNSLGVLHYELGQKEKALSCYREAVQLKPDQDTFLKNLADYYMMEQGQAENAMKLYLSVLENNPRDVDSLIATGVVCVSLNKTDDARVFFERAMEIEPTNPRVIQAMQQIDGKTQNELGDGSKPHVIRQNEKINAVG